MTLSPCSKEDYFYKHALNVAILCAMIAHMMKASVSEQLDAVTAAVVHDISPSPFPAVNYPDYSAPVRRYA